MRSLEALKLFEQNISSLEQKGKVSTPFDHIHIYYPEICTTELPEGKTIGLTLSAIIHGNEVGGISVLNQTLDAILKDQLVPTFPIAFFLGNVSALHKNARFIEKDLNRSFMLDHEPEKKEEFRAQQLETILKNTYWYLDIHQTTLANEKPFFIFPYSPLGYHFASSLWSKIPIVTHWQNNGFSTEGRCSDELVIAENGVGITLEIGQNGYDLYQVAVGAYIANKAVTLVGQWLDKKFPFEFSSKDYPVDQTFLCDQVRQPDPLAPVLLDPGFRNFSYVEKGTKMGKTKGGKEYFCPVSGYILFPKYVDEKTYDGKPVHELFWTLNSINKDDLLAAPV